MIHHSLFVCLFNYFKIGTMFTTFSPLTALSSCFILVNVKSICGRLLEAQLQSLQNYVFPYKKRERGRKVTWVEDRLSSLTSSHKDSAGRRQRLGEVKSPAPGDPEMVTHRGKEPRTGLMSVQRRGCSETEAHRRGPKPLWEQKSQTPRDLMGLQLPRTFHTFTSTFHLQNHCRLQTHL